MLVVLGTTSLALTWLLLAWERSFAERATLRAARGMDALAASPFCHLPPEMLRLVVDAVDEGDAFVFASTCTPFRAAMSGSAQSRFPGGIPRRLPLMEPSVDGLISPVMGVGITLAVYGVPEPRLAMKFKPVLAKS